MLGLYKSTVYLNMLEILQNHCTSQNGLLLFNPPTGTGKTHSVLSWIETHYKTYCKQGRKIFFITNLKKNLPYEELRDDFFKPKNKLHEFDKHFIFLDANADCLVNEFLNVEDEINDYFKNHEIFRAVRNVVIQIHKYKHNASFKVYVEDQKQKLRLDLEPKFRGLIEHYLKENYKDRAARVHAIQRDKEIQWIGKIYPAVFSSQKKVFFLSVQKFYHKNSTLVEPSYSFLENEITKDAIIFIDEFDATKKSILSDIIEKGNKQRIDFIHFFNEIYWALSNNTLPQKFVSHSDRKQELLDNGYGLPLEDIQNVLLEKAEKIQETYDLDLSFKAVNGQNEELASARKRNLLFHDFRYHTVYRNNHRFIRLHKNDEKKINEIHFQKTYPTTGENIVRLLNQIRGFINFFSAVLKSLAENYQQLEMQERKQNPSNAEFTFDMALSTVIEEFGMEKIHKYYLIDNILNARQKPKEKNTKSEKLNFDLSFYEKGFRYYDFVDDDSHQSKTKVFIYNFQNTPEKFIIKLAEKAKVVGISATALCETVTGNYDIKYLKRQLGKSYINLSQREKQIIADNFHQKNKHYDQVKIHTEWLKFQDFHHDFQTLFGNQELGDHIFNKLKERVRADYLFNRYLKISHAFKQFLIHDDIKGFLCLLNKEPKRKDAALDLNILEEIFDILIQENEKQDLFTESDTYSVKHAYKVINSHDFDNKKQMFIKRLESGKSVFIISMYQTMGAGQNLQYVAPNPETLVNVQCSSLPDWNKQNKTDINAIYLDKPTHIIQKVDKNLTDEGFIKYLFQLEFLLQIGIISIKELNFYITKAFEFLLATRNSNEIESANNQKLYQGKNIEQHYAQIIIQAIGRICRTNLKSQNIYIYVDEELDEYLCHYDIENNPVLNEFKALVNASRQCIDDKKNQDFTNKTLSSTVNSRAYQEIQKYINHSWQWKENQKQGWEKLREMCLRFPTITKADAESFDLNRVLDMYLELPKLENKYYFKMVGNDDLNDYKEIEVDFERNIGMEISAESSRLNELLEIDGVEDYFTQNKWATTFEPSNYIIAPVLFNNIYKGALGEQVGKFIFEHHFQIELEELPLEDYEKFDYKIKNSNVYIDFKHWREATQITKNEDAIRKKLNDINGEQVLYINILAQCDRNIFCSVDKKIVEIPYLWNTQTKEINHQVLSYINA